MTPAHKAGEPQQDPEGTVPALPPLPQPITSKCIYTATHQPPKETPK